MGEGEQLELFPQFKWELLNTAVVSSALEWFAKRKDDDNSNIQLEYGYEIKPTRKPRDNLKMLLDFAPSCASERDAEFGFHARQDLEGMILRTSLAYTLRKLRRRAQIARRRNLCARCCGPCGEHSQVPFLEEVRTQASACANSLQIRSLPVVV